MEPFLPPVYPKGHGVGGSHTSISPETSRGQFGPCVDLSPVWALVILRGTLTTHHCQTRGYPPYTHAYTVSRCHRPLTSSLLQWHTPRDLLPTLHSQQAPAVPQHPAIILRPHPHILPAVVFTPSPIAQSSSPTLDRENEVQEEGDGKTRSPLLRPWGQISHEADEKKRCRRVTLWLLPDPPQAKPILAAPRSATGLGPGAGCLPPPLSSPLAGLSPSPPSEQPSRPLPPSSLALTSSALGSLTHCFPSLPHSWQKCLPLP